MPEKTVMCEPSSNWCEGQIRVVTATSDQIPKLLLA